jgi:predicted nucleic acid-binding protein
VSAGVARALLDANIFISYLLGSSGHGPILTPVEAAFARTFTPLVSDALSEEFIRRVQTKPYLA